MFRQPTFNALHGSIGTLKRFINEFCGQDKTVVFSYIKFPTVSSASEEVKRILGAPERPTSKQLVSEMLHFWSLLFAEKLLHKFARGRPSHRIAYFIYTPIRDTKLAQKNLKDLIKHQFFSQCHFLALIRDNRLLILIHPVKTNNEMLQISERERELIKKLIGDVMDSGFQTEEF